VKSFRATGFVLDRQSARVRHVITEENWTKLFFD